MHIKEGEKVQAKGIGYVVNKAKAQNFPNLEKVMPIQVQEMSDSKPRRDPKTKFSTEYYS
jgi:hypothetical protein